MFDYWAKEKCIMVREKKGEKSVQNKGKKERAAFSYCMLCGMDRECGNEKSCSSVLQSCNLSVAHHQPKIVQ